MADVIAFGGIPDIAMTGVRSSERIRAQPNADISQLDRAVQIAQRRDDLQGQGNNLNTAFSILSVSENEIIDRASILGVSLGESPTQVSKSVGLIKEVEINRALTILKKNVQATDCEDVRPHALIVSRASNHCENLSDDEISE
jgi:hypothetical protein